MKKINVAILGASGYTGADLVRLLALHPNVRIAAITGERKAGKTMAAVFPHLTAVPLPDLTALVAVDFSKIDAVFCALPHGTTQTVIAGLPHDLKIIDLSADFRLKDPVSYAKWYGHEHKALDLQQEAVYGLTELGRDQIRSARLVANPGCYPTSAQLPLVPLIQAGAIDPDFIVIDAKSGVSGAGRGANEANLYSEVTEGVHAYGIGRHRHLPEIEQGLGEAAGRPVSVTFTPHLMPMSRGMLSTIYVRMATGLGVADARAVLADRYRNEPFVKILPEGVVPATRHVRGSNYCMINVFPDNVPGRVVICSVIDNLVKGASGQAIQNFNLMFGLPEDAALGQQPMFP